MIEIIAKLMDIVRFEVSGWRRLEDDTWDAAFAEARRQFPTDRFQQEVDALVELQRRGLRGERRHDA